MKKQRGIVFTGGEGPEPRILRRLLDGCVKGALLAAADSGLILAETAGLRPDWIVGDMDSLGGEDRLRSYLPERVIRHAADKDFTDTELALALLWEKGCDEVWIAGGGGGRIDHLLGIRDLFEREQFPRRWMTAAEDIHCIDSDDAGGATGGNLSITLKPGDVVSVFPLGGGPWKAESKGLKWSLDNVHWERGRYGLSNAAAMPEVEVIAQQGRFMVILEGVWRHI
ncbi:MAG: thiamine diphosphokinase [Treponema sp.]|jgi:thiamine pyrophosphokinase|nr:thiamine diphosphokinase [Treponema sp.]